MLKVYTINQDTEWDSIVKSFSQYDVYYLSGYVKAFQRHGDGEPLMFYWESKNLRGVNVVMKRDIAKDLHFKGLICEGDYFDLTTPYGYGGWLFEGDFDLAEAAKIIEEYTNWCNNNGIISEFVRFHPVLKNESGINEMLYDTVFLGNTVAIELDSEEAIWERYTSKNRSHIRVARKEGITVKTDTSKDAFDIFQSIYKKTMDHDDAASYYYFKEDFFESIRNDLDGQYTIFTAYLEDKAIASAIMLYAGNYMNYHLSGQLYEYRRYAGTNMILNEAAVWGCRNGYDWLHLGGGLGAKEGPLYDFKKSFYKKGEDKQFFIGRKIFNPYKYDNLVAMRQEQLPDSFFPKYRA